MKECLLRYCGLCGSTYTNKREGGHGNHDGTEAEGETADVQCTFPRELWRMVQVVLLQPKVADLSDLQALARALAWTKPFSNYYMCSLARAETLKREDRV
jgi:hypothetical protein